jgi:hypothetical protein
MSAGDTYRANMAAKTHLVVLRYFYPQVDHAILEVLEIPKEGFMDPAVAVPPYTAG